MGGGGGQWEYGEGEGGNGYKGCSFARKGRKVAERKRDLERLFLDTAVCC